MLMLISRQIYLEKDNKAISIHLMLMLIHLIDSLIIKKGNFNTSHVNVNQV